MSNWRLFSGMIRPYRSKLGLTYVLYGLEMAGSLLRPFLIGLAINGLIEQDYTGLIYLVTVHIVWMILGYIRHRYDTRTYTSIYNEVIHHLLKKNYTPQDVSRLSAQSVLAKDLVEFLEYDVYFIIEAAYNIFGSLVLLAYYHSSIIWLCLAILIPVAIISIWYSKKINLLQQLKNDELELQVNAIASGDKSVIKKHYESLRTWQIKISDHEALNFGMMECIVITVITGALLISSSNGEAMPQAGDFVGIYYYILKFVSGLDTVPYALQRWSFLGDILNRLMHQQNHTETISVGNPVISQQAA